MNMGESGTMGSAEIKRKQRRMASFISALAGVVACLCLFAVGAQAEPFEITNFSGEGLTQALTPSTTAGAHPFELRTTFAFNEVEITPGASVPVENLKDVSVELPPGVVATAASFPHCSQAEMEEDLPATNCSPYTQIGVAKVVVGLGGPILFTVPVYNLAPPPGVPAQFGFMILASVTHMNFHVRSAGDYGVTATIHNVNTTAPVYSTTLSIWGVPGDPAHSAVREETGTPLPGAHTIVPFINNPTACNGPLTTTMKADSYQKPSVIVTASDEAAEMIGCENVPFHPSLTLAPTSSKAGAPAGMAVDLKLPQSTNPQGTATAELKKAEVTLPQGVALSPSAADGLQACSNEQFGLGSEADPACPSASKVGSATVDTPLLEKPMQGSIYVGTQLSNDPTSGQMFRLFLVVSEAGVTIKLPGSVTVDPVTGQIKATFDNNPQLPFEDLHLEFNGGSRALIVTPQACGTYETTSVFTPWSSPAAADVTSSSFFTIDEGCASHGFAPSFVAGNQTAAAGAFSPFSVTFSRQDGEQEFAGISVQAPPGLLGMLSSVPLCPEAQAAAGSCSSASQIGHVTVGAGPGSNPVYLPQAGQPANPVYLTEGYKGAPFGLSIVTPAVAGPFNLGTVVVRAAINVDPKTSAITITSDSLPTILGGVPLEIKTVNVAVDRPGFMFNSTNCEAQQVNGTMSSAQGASVAVSNGYEAVNCAKLPFKPVLSASTQGNGSEHGNGASLTVKIAAKQGPQRKAGEEEANIRKVDVSLPLQLPSRLKTLQKACPEAQFAANPAGCPAASDVGTAVARTPVLPVPVSGPAYLVSHGGAAFPDLVLVLQGYGVKIILTGNTQIKKGITYSRFDTAPDVPISSFELKLPEGPFSVFAANGKLCASDLRMPTDITGQNGATLHQSTPIKVEGCSKRLAIASHSIKNGAVTISVYAPSAGTLSAGGNGLTSAVKSAKGRETVKIKLTRKTGGKLSTTVKIRFTPSAGRKQTKSLRLQFKK
jgi:hypothetical protein